MINLLTQNLTRRQIADILTETPRVPFLPRLNDSAWKPVIGRPVLAPVVEEIRRLALAEADEPMPVLTDELYSEFSRTGARSGFERPHFERRRRTGRAAFALLALHQAGHADVIEADTLKDSFLRKLRDLAEEESWAVPAHVRHASGKDPMCIDLFSGETAYAVAEYLTVFGDIIPADLRTMLQVRLRTQFFQNYLRNKEAFLWVTCTNNWNAVCHQGVLGAALMVEDDNEVVADLLSVAAPGLAKFLGGFSDDGGCSEGPGYWSYGFGWFAVLNEQLEHQTGGRLSLFAGDDKVHRIARYAPAVSLAGGHSVNFADGGGNALPAWLLHYVGTRLGEGACVRLAVENWQRVVANLEDSSMYHELRASFFHWRRIFAHVPHATTESSDHADSPSGQGDSAAVNPDAYLPSLGVWVVRGRDHAGHLWEVAAKGGNNNEHHNHNDIGSFILHVDGVPFIAEIGAPQYVRDFFRGETRYGFLAARSLGHSVPLINGFEQVSGKEYFGTITRADIGSPVPVFELDAAKAWPAEAGCRSFTRRLILDKAKGQVLLEDDLRVDAGSDSAVVGPESAQSPHSPVQAALIADAAATVSVESPKLATITKAGLTLSLALEGEGEWEMAITRPEFRTHAGEDSFVHRLTAICRGPESGSGHHRFSICMTVKKL